MSEDLAQYLVSILNAASLFGRVLPGYVADKIGRFNTLLIMIVFTLVTMLSLWLPVGNTSLPALYSFAALFGFGTGSWMALTPACVGQLCRADEFGRYYGSLYFVASLATLVCIPITGTSVNPARSIGPALFEGGRALSQLWLFIVAPFVGAAVSALVWNAIGSDEKR